MSKVRFVYLLLISNIVWIAAGSFINVLNENPILNNLIVYILIANISVLYIYFTHINQTSIEGTNMVFSYNHFKIAFNINELNIVEKQKVQKFKKYKRLIIRGNKFWPVVKIDTDEWQSDYIKLKEYFVENNLIK